MKTDCIGKRLLRIIKRKGLNAVFEEFEDLPTVKRKREKNIKILRKSSAIGADALANKLESCEKGYRCGSGACPVCYRLFRKNMIFQTIKALPCLNNLYLVTWNCGQDNISNDQLAEFSDKDLLRIKNRFYQVFKRLDLKYPLIGSFEMVYLPEEACWRPHFHAVTYRENKEKLEEFRRYLHRRGYQENTAPLDVRKIKRSPISTIGYCFKSFWNKRPINFAGVIDRDKELSGESLVSALLALDRLGMRKKLFLRNRKSYKKGSRIVFR